MSWDEEERRVAEILGVKKGEALPDVSRKTLRTYHAYLKANLEFPFQAKVEDLDGEATIHSLSAPLLCVGHIFSFRRIWSVYTAWAA